MSNVHVYVQKCFHGMLKKRVIYTYSMSQKNCARENEIFGGIAAAI